MVLPVLRDMNLVEWRQQVYTQMKFIECITLTTERAIIVVAVAVNIENSCTRSSCVFVYVTVEMCSRTRICVESHFTERNFTISLIERHIIFASTFYCIHCSSSPPPSLARSQTHRYTFILLYTCIHIRAHTTHFLWFFWHSTVFSSPVTKHWAYEWINKMNVNELFMHAYEKQKHQVKVKPNRRKSIIESEKKNDGRERTASTLAIMKGKNVVAREWENESKKMEPNTHTQSPAEVERCLTNCECVCE